VYCPVCHSEYPADWKACPKDATSLLKSAQIGKYRIEGMLGVGGMGAVYKATNPDIKGSRVAIKVMNPAIAQAEQIRERFKREAAAVAALRTSHVVKVYDFNAEPDGTLYLVMELLDGHALRDEIMPAPSYMDLARIQMVMEGALKGLAAAHKVGIVHRDLKPENIFVADTDDGEVPKLLDFGIARVRTQDKNLTHTGSLMGTASYMATEQIAAGVGEIGPWSDVYAMGAILYEMLAGAPAFGGNTVTEVLQRVLKSEIVPLQSVRPGLSNEVYALVERCMSTTPSVRPQDAEAMRIALNAARMVPQGTLIPPPHKTRVDSVPPIHVGSSPGGTALGVMATEGRDTPLPKLTPSPQITPATGTNPTPVASTTPVRPSSDVSAFGPTVGVTSTPPPVTEPAKKSKLPLILGGVAVAGIGAFVAIKVAGGGGDDKPVTKADAGVIATPTPDAAAPADTVTVVTTPDAPEESLPPFTKEMVKFAAGEYDVGEETPGGAGSRKLAKVSVGEFFIDKDEITLDAVRKALTSPKLGGAPGDAGTLPARSVTWGQAVATCKALGKRLPTENEWEIAARTTPKDPAKAALKTASGKLVATAHTDCSADGLCDMLGGVIEWTADGAKDKVVRGAAFTVSAAAGWPATIFFRTSVPPTADPEVGFRCAWSKGGPEAASSVTVPPPPPAQKPSQACEDVDGMYQEARRLTATGNHAAAIAKAEAAIACKPEPRGYVTIAIAACSSRNAEKAKSVADKIQGPGQRMVVGQACADAGIELPGFDGVGKLRDRDRPRRNRR
jgi:serine/threonine protein kinase